MDYLLLIIYSLCRQLQSKLNHFNQQKFHWHLIKLGLKAYFSGRAITKVLKKELSKEPPLSLIKNIERWLQLYDLLNWGWEEIEKEAEKHSVTLPVDTPGEAIEFILEQSSLYDFSECWLPYYSISAQTFYRDYQNWQRIQRKKVTTEPLTIQEKKTLEKLTKRFNNNPRKAFMKGAFLEQSCLNVWSRSKDRKIKKRLKDYLQTVAEYQAEVVKPLHPRTSS